MFPQQTDLTFGLNNLADTTSDAPSVREVYIWMQNNSPAAPLAEQSTGTSAKGYTWPTTTQGGNNYVGIRQRYSDTQYTGAGGITGAATRFVDATTSDLNVVKLYTADGSLSATNKITTIAADGRFAITGTGNATITYRYTHPDDPSVIVSAVLFVTGA